MAVVDVEDVYDEFSAGEKDAVAIRSFLSSAVRNWPIPPRYVLLAGAGRMTREAGSAGPSWTRFPPSWCGLATSKPHRMTPWSPSTH